MKIRVSVFCLLIVSSFIALPAHAVSPPVFIEDMTWMEVHDRIKAGATTVIIPTGGTGQEGPQMVEGKHTIVMRYAAGEIARKLGDTLVAPVLPFVPEGRISPPEGHMQFAGTMSLSGHAFAAVLEDLAHSLKSHGFKRICFIGDHGGAQAIQQQVADKLNSEWEAYGVRVIQVSDYYYRNGEEAWNDSMSLKVRDATVHGGHTETSELMAIDPTGVRDNLRAVRGEHDYKTTGAMGDSSQASAKYGKKYVSLKIQAAVRQIQNAD